MYTISAEDAYCCFRKCLELQRSYTWHSRMLYKLIIRIRGTRKTLTASSSCFDQIISSAGPMSHISCLRRHLYEHKLLTSALQRCFSGGPQRIPIQREYFCFQHKRVQKLGRRTSTRTSPHSRHRCLNPDQSYHQPYTGLRLISGGTSSGNQPVQSSVCLKMQLRFAGVCGAGAN